MGLKLVESSSYLPSKLVTNKDLEDILDTSDSWIKKRTGITSRYIAKDEELSDMLIKALDKLKISEDVRNNIGAVIVASSTSDSIMPNLASIVHRELDLKTSCFSLDINMACSGYVAGLRLLNSILQEGEYGLLIGGELLSKIIDYKDRSTAILFGDGVGVSLFKSSKSPIYFDYGTIGDIDRLACFGINILNKSCKLKMDGKEVYKFAVDILPRTIENLLKKSTNRLDDIDYIILHQANERIIEQLSRKLNLDRDKFPMNIARVGNTSSASIPLLIDELSKSGINLKGKKVILVGFGAGLTWVSSLLEW